MLKWLVNEKEGSGGGVGTDDIIVDVTDDPFATIAGLYNKKYEKTYSVSRSNPVFLDESGPTINTEEVLEKGHNLYRTNSNSSGYGSSSASQEIGDNITRIYIESNPDEDDKVTVSGVSPLFVWHKDENDFDTEEDKDSDKDLITSDFTKTYNKHHKVQVMANPKFVESIQVGKHSLWGKSGPHTMDSLVTNDLLLLTSYSEGTALSKLGVKDEAADNSNRGMENMDKVIEQLTAAVMRSKNISTLTSAMARSKERKTGYITSNSTAGKLRKQRHKQSGDKSGRSSQTSPTYTSINMRNNNDLASLSGSYEIIQQAFRPENQQQASQRQPSYQRPNHQPLYDKASPPGWILARKEEKQTSFKSYQHKQQDTFISWGNRKEVFGTPGSNFTLDKTQERYLKKEEKKRSCAVIFCKSICFLLLISSFLLVIVLVSVFISNGKSMFGPM